MLCVLNQNLICSDTSEKIWLSHAYLCCGAPALPVYCLVFTINIMNIYDCHGVYL